MTDDPESTRDPVEQLAESFQARLRRGERPSLADYVARCPERADDIRDLFPALVALEQLKPDVQVMTSTPEQPAAEIGPAAGPLPAHPERLGDYQILRVVGVGGMGIVYEAEHASLKNRVALKVMHPRFRTDPTYLRRFNTEARSAARLHHTNIVPVFDYGEQNGICYYAMPLIAGVGLHQVLEDVRRLRATDDPKNAPEAKGTGAQPATEPVDETLRTVSHGLLTGRFSTGFATPGGNDPSPTLAVDDRPRDATGGNGDAEEVVVSASSGSVSRTDSHTIAGQSERVYHKEIARLAGQVADALDYAHGQRVVHRDIKPSNLLLDTQGNIWVTDFGLAKLVEGDDLSQSHELVGTLRFMAPERFRGVTDRRADIYAVGATLYEMLALKPAFGERDHIQLIDQITHLPPPPLRQHDRRIPRDLETIVLKALAKDPKDRFATAGEMRDELRLFLEGRPIRSRPVGPAEQFWRWCKRNPALAAANITAAVLTTVLAIGSTIAAWTLREQVQKLHVEQEKTRSNLNWAVKAERTATERLGETQKAEHKAQMALGQSLISEGAALQRTGLIGQRFESLDRLGKAAQVLSADPEGRQRLPEIRNHAIAALGLTDLRVRRQHDCGDVFSINVDAALKRYAVIEKSGAVVVRRLDDDRELIRLPGPDQRTVAYAWAWTDFSPDGELLMAFYGVGGADLIRVWHLGGQELLGTMSSRNGAVFHPDGRRLLLGAMEGGIAVWDRFERRVVRRLPLDFIPKYTALDREGRRLAVNNTDVAAPRVTILEIETGHVLADWRSRVGNGAMAWSADGQLLAIGNHEGDPRVYVWNVRRGALASVLQGHTGEIIGAQFAHSGYLLATSSWDGTSRFWDAASGEPLAMAPGWLGRFSPDDRWRTFSSGGMIGVCEAAAGAECRTLHPGMLGNRNERRDATAVTCAEFNSDGRLLATTDADGVRLWEADTGRELTGLTTGLCETVLFHPDGQSLISSGPCGLYRWPIRLDPEHGPDAIRVGPPELLRENAGTGSRATWLPDGRTLALTDNANARVLLVDSSRSHPAWSRAIALDAGENHRMTSVAISSDGRWLAVGGWKEAGVRVWDLHRRRLERVLRPNDAVGDTKFFIGFSPDGRWLISSTHSNARKICYDFWRVGTWEPDRGIDQERNGIAAHQPVFTGDGRLMALGIAPDQVLLADAATGGELARLTTLQPVTPTPLVFSPDGTKLVARTDQKTALVWDLRRIRDELAPLGLDWDAPPYPAASAVRDSPGPLPPPRPVRVIGEVIEPQARRAAELAEMNRRLAANPDDADALIHRGWLFTQQKKWPDAIADLERGSHLRPDDADALFLLAQAYSNTTNLPAARATLEAYLARSADDIDARIMKGQVALLLGRLQEAVDDFTKVLDADPGRNPVRYRHAEIWLRMGRFQEALADLAPLIERFPQDPALYELRSQVHDRLGHREQAQADLKRVLELPTANAEHYNNLAWRLATGPVALRDPEQALALARTAVALSSGTAIYLNTLGVAQYRAGQYTEAIATLERSLAASKGESDAFDLFFLAMARHRLGQIAQARADFDRALRWRHEHPTMSQPGWSEELDLFRTEAEEVLAGAQTELPAEVFAPE
jgi:eukaryotic-like serine/threonine-protein kinase